MSGTEAISAASSGAFTIDGDLTVNRLGYGAMRITGPGIWGPPADKAARLELLIESGSGPRLARSFARPRRAQPRTSPPTRDQAGNSPRSPATAKLPTASME